MDNRRELKNRYKNRTVTGGVFCIRCAGNGHVWLKSAPDLRGQRNKFEFSVLNNSCPEPGMREEWKTYGPQSFSFAVLEELQKKETQSDAEFAEDLKTLLELWREKQAQGCLE